MSTDNRLPVTVGIENQILSLVKTQWGVKMSESNDSCENL